MTQSLSLLAILVLALTFIGHPAASAQQGPDPRLQPDPKAPLVQEPAKIPTLASLALPLAKLADWGRREFEYRLSADGPSLGTIVMETKVEKDTVTLHDRFDLQLKGTTYWLERTATGPLENLLRPAHLECKGTTDDGDGKTFEFKADFAATKATVTSEGKTKERDAPAGTLTDMAEYRVLTLLPRRAGFSASYDRAMDADELNSKAGGTITCVGQEDVGPAGRTTKAWRFDVSSGKRAVLSAWVDDEGRLVRICLDGTKWFVAKG